MRTPGNGADEIDMLRFVVEKGDRLVWPCETIGPI